MGRGRVNRGAKGGGDRCGKGEEIDLMELDTEEEDEQGDLMERDIESDDNKLAIEMAKVAWDKPKISTRLHLSLG